MKQLKFMTLGLVGLILAIPARAQKGPESGTYFIVNVATGRALTPVDAGVNSNTRLKDFKKSGMQKWTIKKQVTKGQGGQTPLRVFTCVHTMCRITAMLL